MVAAQEAAPLEKLQRSLAALKLARGLATRGRVDDLEDATRTAEAEAAARLAAAAARYRRPTSPARAPVHGALCGARRGIAGPAEVLTGTHRLAPGHSTHTSVDGSALPFDDALALAREALALRVDGDGAISLAAATAELRNRLEVAKGDVRGALASCGVDVGAAHAARLVDSVGGGVGSDRVSALARAVLAADRPPAVEGLAGYASAPLDDAQRRREAHRCLLVADVDEAPSPSSPSRRGPGAAAAAVAARATFADDTVAHFVCDDGGAAGPPRPPRYEPPPTQLRPRTPGAAPPPGRGADLAREGRALNAAHAARNARASQGHSAFSII